jgi:toxin ParE1/3/4
MKRRIDISPAARHDLADVWSFVSQDNEDAATHLIQSFYRQCVVLSDMPNLGRARDRDLGEGLRSYPIGNYVIFYRFDNKRLEMVRVAHSARDIGEVFGPE